MTTPIWPRRWSACAASSATRFPSSRATGDTISAPFRRPIWSRHGLMRPPVCGKKKMRLCNVLLLCSLFALPAAAEDLTIVSWGGAYEAAQREAVIAPFVEETGHDVTVDVYDGTWTALAERGADQGWDVIDMLDDQARVPAGAACCWSWTRDRCSRRTPWRISHRPARPAVRFRKMPMPALWPSMTGPFPGSNRPVSRIFSIPNVSPALVRCSAAPTGFSNGPCSQRACRLNRSTGF